VFVCVCVCVCVCVLKVGIKVNTDYFHIEHLTGYSLKLTRIVFSIRQKYPTMVCMLHSIKETSCKYVDRIRLAQHGEQVWTLVNTVMNLRFV
jgi:hypothetical protein